MKKLGSIFREASENRIKDYLKESRSVLVISYSKLTSPDLSSLRQILKATNVRVFVAKNSIARRALKESGLELLIKLIEGPCGLVFIKDEPVAASKALCDFSKSHENLKLEGGFFGDNILDVKDIQAFAKLPSKEVLRAQVVMTLKSPINGLVMVLKGNLRKVVYCLWQIKEKKNAIAK
ncbi:MAG: 50S ribosomal protein L10 [Candidatus Omnitrophota bacterium]